MERSTIITLESLDEPDTVPILGFNTVNFWTVVGPLCGGLMLGVFLDLGILSLALGLIGFVIGLAVVYASPPYLNILEAVSVWRYYLSRNTEVKNVDEAAAAVEDSLVTGIGTEEATQEFVGVTRYYPSLGIIKRDDGTYATAIKITPPNLDFSSGDELRIAQRMGDFVNEQLTFDLELWITTTPFPIRAYIDNLRERRKSGDVQSKPIMDALLDEQIQRRPEQLRASGTQLTAFYLIVELDEDTVTTSTGSEQTPMERLSTIPILGIVPEIFINVSDEKTELERTGEILRELTERTETVRQGLFDDIEAYSATQVSLAEWVLLLQRFYKGRESPGEATIRRQAVQTATFDDGTDADSHQTDESDGTQHNSPYGEPR